MELAGDFNKVYIVHFFFFALKLKILPLYTALHLLFLDTPGIFEVYKMQFIH